MIDGGGESVPPNPPGGPRLADLTEEITGRLLAGEAFDAKSYIARHPDCAGPILELLPTIHHLAELGRALARASGGDPRPETTHPPRREDPLP